MYCLPPGPPLHHYNANQFPARSAELLRTLRSPLRRPLYPATSFGKLVVTGKPDGIRAIYTARHEILEIFASSIAEPVLGAASLMLTYGEQHRNNRKIVAHYSTGKEVWRYGELMGRPRAARARRTGVRGILHRPGGNADITADIFLHVLFGDSAKDVNRLAKPPRNRKRTRPSIVYDAVLAPRLRRSGAVGKVPSQDASGLMMPSSYDLIARRPLATAGEDVLSMLLAARYEDGSTMDNVEVARPSCYQLSPRWPRNAGQRTFVGTLLATPGTRGPRPPAGGDTTRLGAISQPLRKFQRCLISTAVCCETLRRNPILPEVSRRLPPAARRFAAIRCRPGGRLRPWHRSFTWTSRCTRHPGCSDPSAFLAAVLRVRVRYLWRRDASLRWRNLCHVRNADCSRTLLTRVPIPPWKARSQCVHGGRNFPFGPLDAVQASSRRSAPSPG